MRGLAQATEAVQTLQGSEIALRAELARRHLYDFLKEFWDVTVSDPFSDNWHIEKLCRELEIVFWRAIERKPKLYDLIINIPPGTTKSTIVTKMFPVWAWVNEPNMHFITSSYILPLSLDHADTSRDIINSAKFETYYPHLQLRRGRDAKSNYQMTWFDESSGLWRIGGKRYSSSVGGSVMGMHGHIILLDDPIDPRRAEKITDADRITANKFVDRTLPSRKIDKEITPTVLIMQRLHQDDPTGHILSDESLKVKHICLPGKLSDDPNIQVKPKEWEKYYKNGLLDPKRLSRTVLKELMSKLGQYGYSGQVLQHPVPLSGGMFKIDKIPVLTKPPNPINARQKVYYWDKAGTAGGGAYTAGVLMWEMKKGRFPYQYVIMKVVRGQWGSAEREENIKHEAELCEKGTLHVVEQEPGSGGKESAEATIKNLAGYRAKADRPTGNKILRADPFSVQVNWGNVAIVNGPWVKPFLGELEFWPLSTYLDQGDAAAGAFNTARKVKRAGAW